MARTRKPPTSRKRRIRKSKPESKITPLPPLLLLRNISDVLIRHGIPMTISAQGRTRLSASSQKSGLHYGYLQLTATESEFHSELSFFGDDEHALALHDHSLLEEMEWHIRRNSAYSRCIPAKECRRVNPAELALEMSLRLGGYAVWRSAAHKQKHFLAEYAVLIANLDKPQSLII